MRLFVFVAILFIETVAWGRSCGAEVEKGLAFHSYEVPPNSRTSLVIPAEEESRIKFNRFFTLEFDLKINVEKECFGYVCRIVVDDRHPIDLILSNPVSGLPYLGITTSSHGIAPLTLDSGGALDQWNRISIDLVADGENLSVRANNAPICEFAAAGKTHTARVLFGANTCGVYATSDVAPMVLRDIALSLQEHKQVDYFWELGYGDDLSDTGPAGTLTVGVTNPEWLVERHCHWQKLHETVYDSKVFPVLDAPRARVLFVSSKRVDVFGLRDWKIQEYPFSEDISENLITNDFLVLPDGRLIYYDFESRNPVVNAFDFDHSRWQRPIHRTTHSKYLHHNVFYNPADSSVVQLFGYGFHRYLNEMVRWSLGSDTVSRAGLDDIAPRYLSAVGLTDSVAYIYGGKGNSEGIQEFGTAIYNDLYRLDLKDYSVRKLWERTPVSEVTSDLDVAASNLVISEDGESFIALFYSPNSYNAHLQLTECSLADGERRVLADSIPYNFIDVDSEAGLLFDPESRSYYAVVVEKDPEGGYLTRIYSILSPVLNLAEEHPQTRMKGWWWYLLSGLLAGCGAGFVLYGIRRRRRRRSEVSLPQNNLPQSPEPEEHKDPGIYLMGGFRVIDAKGEDITSNFTPVMRQLLVLIILHADKQSGGISNVELKEALWSDKSEESYYNNRGVNIRKLRKWLEEIGELGIVSTDSCWRLSGDVLLCDYIRYNRYLDSVDVRSIGPGDLQTLIRIAHSGTLLPDMRSEWCDRFKASYTDKIIVLLGRIRDDREMHLSADLRIQLADAILLFDSLDEDSIRVKCQALIQQKRHGIAENVFNLFTQEYKRLMGEDFRCSFDRFIKDRQ